MQIYWSILTVLHFVLTYRTWYKHIGHFQLLHISCWLTERDINILVIFSCFTFRVDLPNVIKTYWSFSAASHFVLTYRTWYKHIGHFQLLHISFWLTKRDTNILVIFSCFTFRSDLPNDKPSWHYLLLCISFWLTERDANMCVTISCFTFRSDFSNLMQTYWA
jgi:hypothetical protein